MTPVGAFLLEISALLTLKFLEKNALFISKSLEISALVVKI